MNKDELLNTFSAFEHPHGARGSVGATSPFERLPSSPGVYVEFVREYYGSLTRAVWDSWTSELAEFYRVEGALRELLYRDARTLEAFLWVVDWVVDQEGLAHLGVNPLAAIRSLCDKPLPRVSDEEVVDRMQAWMKNPDLEHNARECRNAILRRRPDLRRGFDGA